MKPKSSNKVYKKSCFGLFISLNGLQINDKFLFKPQLIVGELKKFTLGECKILTKATNDLLQYDTFLSLNTKPN